MKESAQPMRRACLHSGRRSGLIGFSTFLAALTTVAFPTLLHASTVTIAWNPNTEPDVSGYVVFFGTRSGNYSGSVDVGASTSALMNVTDPSATYYFAVAAYSTAGVRSPLSAEVSWSVAAPSLTNPGSQTSTVGQNVALQLLATDPAGLALTYGASGLPPGLAVGAATGVLSGVPSTPGAYPVTVSATNSAGAPTTQLFTWSILTQPAVTPTFPNTTPPLIADAMPPTISITSPTTTGTYTTDKPTVALEGGVFDDVSVVSVRWKNDRGGQGAATFSGAGWTVPGIELKSGPNLLTVTAVDGVGNTSTDAVTITLKTSGKK